MTAHSHHDSHRTSSMEYAIITRGCVIFQSIVRGILVRKHQRLRSDAAFVIQRTWKMTVSRGLAEKVGEVQVYPSKSLAQRWIVRNVDDFYLASIVIGRMARGYLVRKKMIERQAGARKIQLLWRGRVCRATCVRARSESRMPQDVSLRKGPQLGSLNFEAVVKIQAFCRMCLARLSVLKLHSAARIIQVFYLQWRMKVCIEKVNKAVVLIQRWSRTCIERKIPHAGAIMRWEVKGKQEACFLDSGAYNCILDENKVVARKDVKDHSAVSDIVGIAAFQAFVRGFLTRQAVRKWHRASFTISRFMLHVARPKLKSLVSSSVVIIQSYIRSFLCRASLRNKVFAAVLIQRHARSWNSTKRREEVWRKAARKIQRYWRKSYERHKFLSCIAKAILIQSLVRGFQARNQIHCRIAAANIIRKFILAKKLRSEYQEIRASVLLIQYHTRNFLVSLQSSTEHRAAMLIQSHIRSYFAQQKLSIFLISSVILQSWARQIWAQEQYKKTRKNVISVQSLARGMITRNRLLAAKSACAEQKEQNHLGLARAPLFVTTRDVSRDQKKTEVVRGEQTPQLYEEEARILSQMEALAKAEVRQVSRPEFVPKNSRSCIRIQQLALRVIAAEAKALAVSLALEHRRGRTISEEAASGEAANNENGLEWNNDENHWGRSNQRRKHEPKHHMLEHPVELDDGNNSRACPKESILIKGVMGSTQKLHSEAKVNYEEGRRMKKTVCIPALGKGERAQTAVSVHSERSMEDSVVNMRDFKQIRLDARQSNHSGESSGSRNLGGLVVGHNVLECNTHLITEINILAPDNDTRKSPANLGLTNGGQRQEPGEDSCEPPSACHDGKMRISRQGSTPLKETHVCAYMPNLEQQHH